MIRFFKRLTQTNQIAPYRPSDFFELCAEYEKKLDNQFIGNEAFSTTEKTQKLKELVLAANHAMRRASNIKKAEVYLKLSTLCHGSAFYDDAYQAAGQAFAVCCYRSASPELMAKIDFAKQQALLDGALKRIPFNRIYEMATRACNCFCSCGDRVSETEVKICLARYYLRSEISKINAAKQILDTIPEDLKKTDTKVTLKYWLVMKQLFEAEDNTDGITQATTEIAKIIDLLKNNLNDNSLFASNTINLKARK